MLHGANTPESAMVGIDADTTFVKSVDDDNTSTRRDLIKGPSRDLPVGFSPAPRDARDVQDPIERRGVDEEWKLQIQQR